MRVLALAFAGLVIASPLAASADTVKPQPSASSGKAFSNDVVSASALEGKEKVICRTSEDTGSRLGASRRCLTAKEWALRDADLRSDMMHDMNSRPSTGPAGN